MSNVDINVDGRTDGRKIGRLYRTLLQAGAIKNNNSWPTNIYYVEKKKYNSVLSSLFMNSNVMCNTAQDFQPMFEQYFIFK